MTLIIALLNLSACAHFAQKPDESLVIDHILYAGPDLEALNTEFQRKSGITPNKGGQHLDLGTHNSIVPLNEGPYLELIAPDPKNPIPGGVKVLGIGQMKKPKVVAWAARVSDFEALYRRFESSNIRITPILNGSRKSKDGRDLIYRYFFVTDEKFVEAPKIIPFFIENVGQPSASEAPCHLVSLSATHPHPENFAEFSKMVRMKIELTRSETASLRATLKCPKGEFFLQ